ncbi:hypothetical protein BGX28_008476 [Mortierella sp. GBA30]|nr:hypothetical protein BGX28_008476 [Mortierella sp. GBA30]
MTLAHSLLLLVLGLGLALGALVAAQDHYHALASGVLFDGVNTADPAADGTAVFRDKWNHADGVASILLYSAKETAFHPADGISDSPESYFDFLQKVADFPAFHIIGTEDKEYDLTLDGSLEQFLDQITDKYRLSLSRSLHQPTLGLLDRIRDAFRGLVPESVDNPSKTRKKWLLSLVILQKPKESDEVTFEMIHVRLTISKEEKSGRALIDQQSASMTVSSYMVIGRYISFYSDELARFIEKGDVDQLISALTTTTTKDQSGEVTLSALYYVNRQLH